MLYIFSGGRKVRFLSWGREGKSIKVRRRGGAMPHMSTKAFWHFFLPKSNIEHYYLSRVNVCES